ncbi:hypothetical protein QUF50_04590 [Thiotrichales bacterium HSG1]|nr:hypothetical protein [Thiotrichales bacterium HSG1]
MTTRTISNLSPELTNILFELGNRKLVFLEGKDDVEIFEEWFSEQLGNIYFHDAGGCENVKTYLNKTLELSSKKEIYGIIDRDFHTDEEVDNSLNNELNHLFILILSEIENYLLEPVALWEELKIYPTKSSFKIKITDSISMEKGLLKICNKLITIVAANLLLHKESTREKYFTFGHSIEHRENIIQQTAKKLNWEFAETEQKIIKQENLIESKLDSLDNAYKIIDGKRILNQIMLEYTSEPKTAKRIEHLRKLLGRRTKKEIHKDILFIIQERILL